jgi:hypothetical protein
MEKVDLLKLSWVVFSMEKGWRILRKNRNESMLGNLSNSSISNSFFRIISHSSSISIINREGRMSLSIE